ncbi:MAG: hypothetical protein JWN51_154, partial [Phycisphaerales bacterium]|nr:hypothetical protein [Phycisphaerales bacterium]
YCMRLIEGEEQPSEELIYSNDEERQFARAITPMLYEPDQLKSGMYLVFRKV